MKKYLLLIEDETLWEKFKETLNHDINSELIELIRERVKRGVKR
jgi:hypothetical protein